VVAWGDAPDGGAHAFHHTRSFVSDDARQWEGDDADLSGEIGVAQAGGDHSYQDFVGAWFVELDLLE
jgi:hypothetical protein